MIMTKTNIIYCILFVAAWCTLPSSLTTLAATGGSSRHCRKSPPPSPLLPSSWWSILPLLLCCSVDLLLPLLLGGLDDVHGVGAAWVGRNVQCLGSVEAACVVEVRSNDEKMLQVIGLKPNVDCLGRETPVGHGHDGPPPGAQHAADLVEDGQGLVQVVHGHHAGHQVETLVLVGQLRLHVQVAHEVVVQLGVLGQLVLVHPGARAPAVLPVLREVAHPGGADVQNVRPLRECLLVEAGEGAHGRVVDVVHEPGVLVEHRVLLLVHTLEIILGERPFGRPLGSFKNIFGFDTTIDHPQFSDRGGS
mmetsp:Transcript_11292/g.19598  ORF Transcript_11292/g.19598 Transcript_11292/m.19598 type:complete len:305 (+) Transcript_11292:181-1095(+)